MDAPQHAAPEAALIDDERVVCPHADSCGGCPLIRLPYGAQLAVKQERVAKAFARYPPLGRVLAAPVTAAGTIVGYRTRAKLVVAANGSVGLFARGGGHEVVDVPHCRVLAPALARVSAYVRARIAARTDGALVPFDATCPGKSGLRALDLREVRDGGSPRVLVTLVVEGSRQRDLASLRASAEDLMSALPEVVGVAANFHAEDTPQVLGSETLPLAGAVSAPDRVGRSLHVATFGSFVQAHRDQASRVHSLLAEALGLAGGQPSSARKRPARVLDLYGGSGAIALGLASAGASVRLIESFGPAAAQASAAARAQHLDLQAGCGDVADALHDIAKRREHFDAAVVNPPRRGTSPAAREGLARVGPSQIAYVSCDPETLARDLDHFARLGYATASLHPFDMIPLTDEVETVALLRRAEAPVPCTFWENKNALAIEKGPHEPTMPQGEYVSSLLVRARRVPGAREAVPVHRHDVGTSGIVLFARRPPQVAAWARALSANTARRIYVAAVRGVTPAQGTIASPLRENGKDHAACTRYRRLAIASGQSILRVTVQEERRHQIRRHLASIGHPILGDDRYGHCATNRYFEEKNALDRTFLHCTGLTFDEPETNVRHTMESPLAGDLRLVLDRIGGPSSLRWTLSKVTV